MWKMRNEAEFDLLTMASRSNYTSSFHLHRDYFDRSQITAMRTTEGDVFTRHLGGHYHCAGMSEATLRYKDSDWDLDFFTAHEVPVAISNNRRAGSAVLRTWIERLGEFLDGRTFDEIWIPLGVGSHSDHDLTRNAALQVILDRQPRSIIRLYEDVPYGAEFQEHTGRILQALEHAGARLTPWPQDVTEHFSKKLDLLTLFASQFKVGSIQSGVERSAGAQAGDRIVEHLWTVQRLPDALPRDEMWFGAPGVAETSAKLAEFSQGSTTARRVAIYAISAAGRWTEDFECLVKLFPKAAFVVYAGPRVCAEFKALRDPRVQLHCLSGGAGSWVMAALREVATGHRIIIAGDAVGNAKLLTMAWPLGRKVVVSDMDHLIQALGAHSRR
jgi:LmbE family N-acetylglucosaminyl deacetylase